MTFANCIALEEVDIPNSVKKIGVGAFFGCSNLEEITIPDSVEKINVKPFSSYNAVRNMPEFPSHLRMVDRWKNLNIEINLYVI